MPLKIAVPDSAVPMTSPSTVRTLIERVLPRAAPANAMPVRAPPTKSRRPILRSGPCAPRSSCSKLVAGAQQDFASGGMVVVRQEAVRIRELELLLVGQIDPFQSEFQMRPHAVLQGGVQIVCTQEAVGIGADFSPGYFGQIAAAVRLGYSKAPVLIFVIKRGIRRGPGQAEQLALDKTARTARIQDAGVHQCQIGEHTQVRQDSRQEGERLLEVDLHALY